MHRWVRYVAPVMVCVDLDEAGDERVVNVVIGEEPEDLRPVGNTEGQPLVYDEYMQLLGPGEASAQRALREAERRQWPEPDTWEAGPDALRFPGLYDPIEFDEDSEDEDLDPLELKDGHASQLS